MKFIILLSVLTMSSAHAITTFNMASKCIPVEHSGVTRVIGATSGVWVRAEAECERLGNIAINKSQGYTKKKTYFPGITMDYVCHKIETPREWRKVGCSGGLELGFLLEVTAEIENPNKYATYYPKEFISYYHNQRNEQQCLDDAQNFAWFSTANVVAEAECQLHGKELRRAVKLKFKW